MRLRDFRTVHAEKLLRSITAGLRTLVHIKVLLGGVFKHANGEGLLDGENPMRDVSVPGRPAKFKGSEAPSALLMTLKNCSLLITEMAASLAQ
jgi:hypothetical protein